MTATIVVDSMPQLGDVRRQTNTTQVAARRDLQKMDKRRAESFGNGVPKPIVTQLPTFLFLSRSCGRFSTACRQNRRASWEVGHSASGRINIQFNGVLRRHHCRHRGSDSRRLLYRIHRRV
jgi:hypothetical protein